MNCFIMPPGNNTILIALLVRRKVLIADLLKSGKGLI